MEVNAGPKWPGIPSKLNLKMADEMNSRNIQEKKHHGTAWGLTMFYCGFDWNYVYTRAVHTKDDICKRNNNDRCYCPHQ